MSPARLVYSSKADLLVTPVPLKGLPTAIPVCPGSWWEGVSPAGPPGATEGGRGQEDFREQPLLGGLRCCPRREEPQHSRVSCRDQSRSQPRQGRDQEEPGHAPFIWDVNKGQAGQVPGSCVQAGQFLRHHSHGKSWLVWKWIFGPAWDWKEDLMESRLLEGNAVLFGKQLCAHRSNFLWRVVSTYCRKK